MSLVNTDFFNDFSFSSIENPTVQNSVLVVGGIALSAFLGYQAMSQIQAYLEQRIRERVTEYVILGCTRDMKLSEDELLVKGEAIGIRKRLCLLLDEILSSPIPDVPEKVRQKLKANVILLNIALKTWDFFSCTKATPSLPWGWSVFESKIKSQLIERIQIKYSEGNSEELVLKRLKQKENLILLIDSVSKSAQEKNNDSVDKMDAIKTIAELAKEILA